MVDPRMPRINRLRLAVVGWEDAVLVLLFPAMKTRLIAIVVLCSGSLCGCYSYHALVPLHDIPAGTVVKDSDFRTEWCGSLFGPMVDLAEDRSRVVGHKALKPLHGGTRFHYSDVTQ
jgi:hypothetical protein